MITNSFKPELFAGIFALSIGILPLAASASESAATCVNGSAAGYLCHNVNMLSHLNLNELGGDSSLGGLEAANDIWGWRDPDTDKQYAIIGLYSGAAFIDISNPSAPVLVAKLIGTPHTLMKSAPVKSTKLCHDGCGGSSGGEEIEVPGSEEQSIWMDIKVYHDVAYVGSEEASYGVQVFDLTRLRSLSGGQHVTADNVLTEVMSSHNLVIDQDNGFLYVVGDKTTNGSTLHWGGAMIYDLSDPLNPTFVRQMVISAALTGESYIHDMWCGTYHGPDPAYQGRQICLGANSWYARDVASGQVKYYCSDLNDYFGDWVFDDHGDADRSNDELDFANGCVQTRPQGFYGLPYSYLVALDVTDKFNIQLLDRVTFDDSAYIHQMWPTDDQAYLYANDEEEEIFHGHRTRLYIYDLSNLDDLQQVSTFSYPTLDIDHNMYVHGKYAYQSNYGAGLRILDVSTPTSPYEAGYFDLRPAYSDAYFLGAWSNYLFDSGVVAVSDIENGLYLLKPAMREVDLKPDLDVSAVVYEKTVDGSMRLDADVYNNGPGDANDIEFVAALDRNYATGMDALTGTMDAQSPDGTISCEAIYHEVGDPYAPTNSAMRLVKCHVDRMPSCTGISVNAGLLSFWAGSIAVSASAAEAEAAGTTENNGLEVLPGSDLPVAEFPVLGSNLEYLRSMACDFVPVVSAGSDDVAARGSNYKLKGNIYSADIALSSVTWEQVSGPTVKFGDKTNPSTTVQLPNVTGNATVVLKLTASTVYGHEASDKVSITVTGTQTESIQSGGGGAMIWLLGIASLAGLRRRMS